MIAVAHVSDIHIDGDERSVERAKRVLQYIVGLSTPVDAILLTGDIADHGAPAEYEVARSLTDLPVPVLVTPGNHDVRGPYRQILLGEPAADHPINSVRTVGGAVFALCDSSVPGKDHGWLADETLAWLDLSLTEAADQPAFVCFHHPPVTLGLPFVDGIMQFGADRLAEVVAGHPNVVAILCGHAHTPAASTFAGLPLLVAPGVVSTVRLPFEAAPVVDFDLPPMLAFHLLGDDGRLTTHYRVVPPKNA